MTKPPPPRKKTEEEELKECFDYFDKDGSGTISLYEMRQTMFEIAAQIGEELSLEEVPEKCFILGDMQNKKLKEPPEDVFCAFIAHVQLDYRKFRTGFVFL